MSHCSFQDPAHTGATQGAWRLLILLACSVLMDLSKECYQDNAAHK